MSESAKEEIIGILWIITGLLCIQNDLNGWAICAFMLGAFSAAASLYYAYKEQTSKKLMSYSTNAALNKFEKIIKKYRKPSRDIEDD